MGRAAIWLLYGTIPVAIFFRITHRNLIWLFVFACLAVLPLAAWIGASTEQLARRMGSTAVRCSMPHSATSRNWSSPSSLCAPPTIDPANEARRPASRTE